MVDALGNPVKLALSPGQTHEMKLAYALLADISNAYVAGDRAYDAAPLAQMLEAHGCSVVIPSNPTRAKQRPYDRHLYREPEWTESTQWTESREVYGVPCTKCTLSG